MQQSKSPKDMIIVALDVSSVAEAARLVSLLSGHVGGFKVGDQLVTAIGVPSAVGLVKAAGERVILDTMFHNTPDVMAESAKAAALHRVEALTLHASAGKAALLAVRAALTQYHDAEVECAMGSVDSVPVPEVFVATVLSSLSGAEAQVIYHRDLRELLHDFAHMAANNGAGIVCGSADVEMLRAWAALKKIQVMAAGVRPSWAPPRGQRRFTSPFDAVRHGADFLVIGSPVISPPKEIGSPIDAVRRIVEEIAAGLAER